jgi:hypothetical protein
MIHRKSDSRLKKWLENYARKFNLFSNLTNKQFLPILLADGQILSDDVFKVKYNELNFMPYP